LSIPALAATAEEISQNSTKPKPCSAHRFFFGFEWQIKCSGIHITVMTPNSSQLPPSQLLRLRKLQIQRDITLLALGRSLLSMTTYLRHHNYRKNGKDILSRTGDTRVCHGSERFELTK
jgi:hypothetical protein